MEKKPFIVTSHDTRVEADYSSWIIELKKRFRKAQIKATIKVNSEMLFFNWCLGRDLVMKRAEEKWGKGIVEQISLDLRNELPDSKGFSTRNLWNMKKWYLFYGGNDSMPEISEALVSLFNEAKRHPQKLQQVVGEIVEVDESEITRYENNQQLPKEFAKNEKLQQVVAEFPKSEENQIPRYKKSQANSQQISKNGKLQQVVEEFVSPAESKITRYENNEQQSIENSKNEKLHQVGEEIGEINLIQNSRYENTKKTSKENTENEKLHQAGAEMMFPEIFGYVPWGHHIEIITRSRSVPEALFYIRKVIEEGWSRRTLIDKMASFLYYHEGNSLSNFDDVLSPIHAALAREMLKDTYDLSFISLPKEYEEEDLEGILEQNITRFLLELGTGFSFIGRQKEIVVSGKTRKIDMLFYHIRFMCYVVVELKVTAFEPEYAGKLNFYVNAVNELMKTEDENPTIGLLICRSADHTEVKWSFQGLSTPIGVAAYKGIREEDVRTALPTIEQIKRRIEQAEEEYRANIAKKKKTKLGGHSR